MIRKMNGSQRGNGAHKRIPEPVVSGVTQPTVSVLMPTYKQAAFIRRAIESLLAQILTNWELIIVDDGSPDETHDLVLPYLEDDRIHYHRFDHNRGLGAALNFALDHAQGKWIAYLPSDDLYYANHLLTLADYLECNPSAILAYSGVRHHYNKPAAGQIEGYTLQLVQVMHRRTPERWMERSELATDDLERMFWSKLRPHGKFGCTHTITCEWVDHPMQRHKLMREQEGGINLYRVYYDVKEPLRYHSSLGNRIDEVEHYRRYRERPDTPQAPDGLKILLVGELAYNADRVLALEERGHKLYGLWIQKPHWYNTVGPLPFGHVEDLPYENWREAIRQVQPDIIYAQLNWQAVPLAHEVMHAVPDIPFVWHFKEGPFISLYHGMLPQLLDLYAHASGQIYISDEVRDWFETHVPGISKRAPVLIMDADLPKRDWFGDNRSPRLSDLDGEIHTVVPGRPIGLHPHLVAELARYGIHLHFYSDYIIGQWVAWVEKVQQLAPNHLHMHSNVDQENWVAEFSKYDAGWLHFFTSENEGEIRRANWDDLNYPARIATLAVAGLPMLQRDNTGSLVATQTLVKKHDMGLFFTSMQELSEQIRDEKRMEELRRNVWQQRDLFLFDTHADPLIAFFRQVIANHSKKQRSGTATTVATI